MPRATNNSVRAYPLFNSGSFTWNKRAREIVFMRAGNPKHKLKDMREGSYFRVTGDDIKLLYQVLHEHFARLTPANSSVKPTTEWREHAPPGPEMKHCSGHKDKDGRTIIDPHKQYPG